MRRNLRKFSLRSKKGEGDLNPLDGVANLADVMLVLACGLMAAVILKWNVNLTDMGLRQVDLTRGKEVTGVEAKDSQMQKTPDAAGGFEKMGILYKDPETGKMYVLSGD